MSEAFPPHPFWDFSLAVYDRPGVAAACLRLQERCGVDVNLLLLCCWAERLGPDRLRQLVDRSEPWQRAVVEPLRTTRNRLKQGIPPVSPDLAETLRQRVLAVELDAEHAAQLTLAAGLQAARDADDAATNIGDYLRLIGCVPAAEDRRDLETVLDAVYPVRTSSLLTSPGGCR